MAGWSRPIVSVCLFVSMTHVQRAKMSLLMLQLGLCLVSVIQVTSSESASDVIQEMVAPPIQRMMKAKDVETTPPPTGALIKRCTKSVKPSNWSHSFVNYIMCFVGILWICQFYNETTKIKIKYLSIYLYKNTFCGTRYLSHCCSLHGTVVVVT